MLACYEYRNGETQFATQSSIFISRADTSVARCKILIVFLVRANSGFRRTNEMGSFDFQQGSTASIRLSGENANFCYKIDCTRYAIYVFPW